MSMLSRYKKAGGFKQLLSLIETSGKQKQEKFLAIIEEEDSAWADELRIKMLTYDRILGWKEDTLSEIFSRQKDISLAIFKKTFQPDQWERICKTFTHSQLRKIEDLVCDGEPSDAEKSTSIVALLTDVRRMITEGFIRLDSVDPELTIHEDIEDKLTHRAPSVGKRGNDLSFAAASDIEKKLEGAGGPQVEEIKKEVAKLKKRILAMGSENETLRETNEEMREKLERIKKIA